MNDAALNQKSVKQLLMLYASVVEELRTRKVVRTSNNPVADYTEYLVAKRMNLVLERNSSTGFDAKDANGVRYQIKARRVTDRNSSRQLSGIRNLDKHPFDLLVGVIFKHDFSVDYAGLVPIQVVLEQAIYVRHTNSYKFIMRTAVLDDSRVKNITSLLMN